MAYVAISGQLIERVQNNIRRMYNKEDNSIPAFKESLEGNEPFVVKGIWGDHLHLMTQMPENWMSSTNNFRAIVIPPLKDDAGRTIGDETTHDFHLLSPIKVPPKYSEYTGKVVDINEPIMQQAAEFYTRKKEVKQRWHKVETDVKSFLQSCKSLNEAVKLWPDVEMYVDKDDIERMGVKREKARESDALAALAKLDTDMLVGAVVISRMSQAAA